MTIWWGWDGVKGIRWLWGIEYGKRVTLVLFLSLVWYWRSWAWVLGGRGQGHNDWEISQLSVLGQIDSGSRVWTASQYGQFLSDLLSLVCTCLASMVRNTGRGGFLELGCVFLSIFAHTHPFFDRPWESVVSWAEWQSVPVDIWGPSQS